MEKTVLNWSSGKDSAMSLYLLLKDPTFKVERLITTLSSQYKRITMHGLREELLDLQAKELQIPLQKIYLPEAASLESYDKVMEAFYLEFVDADLKNIAYGDIFLEDLKEYREKSLKKFDLKATFPLWKQDTKKIMEQFIALGFKAITVSVNANLLDESFVGRTIDESFFNDLPENVDVCGENGEFHTFVYDGPIFENPIEFKVGAKVLKDYSPSKKEDDCFKDTKNTWDTRFWFCDLLPK